MLTILCAILFTLGYLFGRYHEKTLWVYYDRVIMPDGTASQWDRKKRKWQEL